MRKFFLIIVIIALTSPVLSVTNLRELLEQDIEDESLESFSLIDAAFIISGINTTQQLNDAKQWFQSIIDDIQSKRLIDPFEKKESAQKLFLYLHTSWLITYEKEATTLLDIQYRKAFNCVSATILYNLICDEVGFSTRAFETPTHVYTIFNDFGHDVMVENTSPMGFNIINNLHNYSQYMLQYYPEQQMYQIGLDRIYAYENSKGRQISNQELLGLICYNQAYYAFENRSYQKAYEFIVMAQKFNQDSRSSQSFENRIYYVWGEQQYKLKNYYQAFEIFADALYRYPDNKDFKQNCMVSFIKSLYDLFEKKDWETTKVILADIREFDVLSDRELKIQENIIGSWISYFIENNQKDNGFQALEILREINPQNSDLTVMKKTLNSLP
jgi:hypothetical protein